MRIKIILTVVLALFIASSIAAIVVRTIREASEDPQSAPSAAKSAADATGPRVVVYCFHGKVRCPECETIESYGHEAVSQGFAEEIRAGKIEWRVLDYEDSQNLPLAKQYEVIAPTIVVVRLDGGNPVRWDNLSDVWGLIANKPEFLEFVRKNVRSFLADTTGSMP